MAGAPAMPDNEMPPKRASAAADGALRPKILDIVTLLRPFPRADPDAGSSCLCFRLSMRLAPFPRQPLPHRHEVVGREELGREGAPGAALDLDVDDIEQMRRQPQGDDLSDPHHYVPADDLHALGGKALPPAGRGEMTLDAREVLRLIVLEEDRQQDGLGIAAHAVISGPALGKRLPAGLTPPIYPVLIRTQVSKCGAARQGGMAERALADALEAAFGAGEQDFEEVARALERAGIKRPSGAAGPWTAAVLEQELKDINASLDAAYAEN